MDNLENIRVNGFVHRVDTSTYFTKHYQGEILQVTVEIPVFSLTDEEVGWLIRSKGREIGVGASDRVSVAVQR